MSPFDPEALRRWPDIEAPNLFATDASDRLILAEAIQDVRGASHLVGSDVVVIGDRYGALTLGTADAGARGIRVHQDSLVGERALAANAARFGLEDRYRSMSLSASLVSDARVVLLQLPRELEGLDEIATLIAAHARPDVTVVAGGRVKHMSTSMNSVLERSFGSVTASLARQKSRVLRAELPDVAAARERLGRWPLTQTHADLDLTVCAHGAVFAGTGIDIGTRFLLEFLDRMPAAESAEAIDLGCGTGVLATSLARARPGWTVTATDQSAAAVASTRATASANGVADRVTAIQDDGLSQRADESADVIVLNPPFHSGATVHAGVARKMFEHSSRVLRPGGELWVVWNSHLAYRPVLEAVVGPTEQIGRNAKFTVTRSVAR